MILFVYQGEVEDDADTAHVAVEDADRSTDRDARGDAERFTERDDADLNIARGFGFGSEGVNTDDAGNTACSTICDAQCGVTSDAEDVKARATDRDGNNVVDYVAKGDAARDTNRDACFDACLVVLRMPQVTSMIML